MPADDLRQLGLLARTLTLYPCRLCGNLRRHRGEVTLQERRFAQ